MTTQNTNTAISVESLRSEFATLADFNKAHSVTAKSWAQAQKLAKQEQEAAARMGILQNATETTADSEAYPEPDSVKASLFEDYDKVVEALKSGVGSKEAINDVLQNALVKLAKSGNKDFTAIKSLLWLIASEPAWAAEFKQICTYIKAVTPFRVATKIKKGKLPCGKTEKQLQIQLITVAGNGWIKRPAKFWNKVQNKNAGEQKELTKDQFESRLKKIAELAIENKKSISVSDRLAAAAAFISELGLDDLAKEAHRLMGENTEKLIKENQK